MASRLRPAGILVCCAALLGTLTGCSTMGGGDRDATSGGNASGAGTLTVVTHDSFELPDELLAQFREQSGYEVTVLRSGDAGTLTNKLVLTKSNPIGDVAFGIDNTFATRATDEEVFAPYQPELPAGVDRYLLPGDEAGRPVPVDVADVCVNIDTTWFAKNKVKPPATLRDLTDPAYADLMVAPGASTSSPGLAFLLTTIAEFGDDWPQYWSKLMDNGLKITSGWSDAYYADFTQGGQGGDRPVVVSYDSSPAFTVPEGAEASTTAALLDTCFQQVEYAGVLAGTKNRQGAEAFVDFLLSKPVQQKLPESMYVFPVRQDVQLPAEWAAHAKRPDDPYTVDPQQISANREKWLNTWTDITSK